MSQIASKSYRNRVNTLYYPPTDASIYGDDNYSLSSSDSGVARDLTNTIPTDNNNDTNSFDSLSATQAISTVNSDNNDNSNLINLTFSASSLLINKSTNDPVKAVKAIKNFYVTFGTKHDHQWSSYNKTHTSIYLNKKNGPILHLYRGMTYYFHINSTSDEKPSSYNAFMFTTSPCGGRNALLITDGFHPVSQGVICFRVSEQTPRYFFYQNFYEEVQGGLVIVHD